MPPRIRRWLLGRNHPLRWHSSCVIAIALLTSARTSPLVAGPADTPAHASALWLADKHQLLRISPEGAALLRIPVPSAESLVSDPTSGSVWLGGQNAVHKYAHDGSLVLSRTLSAVGAPHRRRLGVLLAIDATGQPWLGWGRVVIALEADGQERFRHELRDPIEEIAFNSRTREAWVATEEALYVFSDAGALIARLHRSEAEDDHRVRMAADPRDGSTWVASGRALIQYSSGHERRLRLRLETRTNDLAVNASTGELWLTQHKSVVKLSSEGQLLIRLDPFGRHARETRPRRLTLDPSTGRLWVASRHLLARVDRDGASLVSHLVFRGVRDLAHFADLVPPDLSIVFPSEGAYLATNAPTLRLEYADAASGIDPQSLRVKVGDTDVSAACENTSAGSDCRLEGFLTLSEGPHVVAAQLADRAGNTAHARVNFSVDTVPPAAPNAEQVEIEPAEDPSAWRVTGGPGSVEPGATVVVRNTRTGEVVSVRAGPDGSFSLTITAEPTDVLELTVLDAAGNTSAAVRVTVVPPPPQTDAAGLIHGIVVDSRTQQPLHGVRVSARGVAGAVVSNAAGRFAFPAPGTGSFALFFARQGYITARRDPYVLSERHATVGEVRLHPYDANTTLMTPSGGTVADSNGKVQAIFPPGAVSQPMPVSATFFATEPDFPLPMPEGTVFVAGVQMTPEHTAFSQPITLRFANDLGFAPGTPIPFAFASHDPHDSSEGFYDSGMATVTTDGAFIELQVAHFSCVALGVAPPPGTNVGEECPACAEQEEVAKPELKCDVPGGSSVCVTDGNVRVEQRLASVGAVGGRDTLEFAYTSSTAQARPILSARTKLSSLYFTNASLSASWKVSLEGVERETHFQGSSDRTHLAYAWDGLDAAGNRLSTGAYHFRAASIGTYAGALHTADTFGGLATSPTNVASPRPLPYRASTGGYLILHDQSKSPFGAGWGISELERLHPQPDGTVLWTSGRGASAVMRPGHARDQKQVLRNLGGRAGGIARDASGALYVGRYNGVVTRIAPDGATSVFATVRSTLSSLAFDRAGSLHALTYDGGLFRISSVGQVTEVVARFGFDLGDMVVDSRRNVFVIDSHHPAIYRVTPAGQASVFARYPFPNQLLTYPSGLAIDANDNLYVSNNYNNPGQLRRVVHLEDHAGGRAFVLRSRAERAQRDELRRAGEPLYRRRVVPGIQRGRSQARLTDGARHDTRSGLSQPADRPRSALWLFLRPGAERGREAAPGHRQRDRLRDLEHGPTARAAGAVPRPGR